MKVRFILLPLLLVLGAIFWMLTSGTTACFYGRVVDQHGAGVPHAEVEYYRDRRYWDSTQASDLLQTDESGNFQIIAPRTQALSITALVPAGYNSTNERFGNFTFSRLAYLLPASVAVPPHHADPAKPVLFKLSKMGETVPLLHIERAGPIQSFNRYRTGRKAEHVLQFDFTFNDTPLPKQTNQRWDIYDWSIHLAVPGGGMVERVNRELLDATSFIAPEDGYQDTLLYSPKPEPGTYRNDLNKEFFVRYGDGSYGRIEVRIQLDLNEDPNRKRRHFAVIDSYLDPAGGRALEYEQTKALEVPDSLLKN
ncbi:hypothetical protein [Haloferula sp. BvORR071]|uniref:hypothetical protein n=1 Tax=Haloferula sp. BvORR071 TaxID=1396141 RepID=UPI00054CE4EC|nr:hypothetical protein [Haloferula sp. BvORR071]